MDNLDKDIEQFLSYIQTEKRLSPHTYDSRCSPPAAVFLPQQIQGALHMTGFWPLEGPVRRHDGFQY